MDLEVTGLDHLYLAVSDFARSEEFYDRVMRLLGFRKGTMPIAGDRHAHYYNRDLQLTIRPARDAGRPHDPYSSGLHHICLRLRDRAAVDAAAKALGSLGLEATSPRLYPEYAPDYYATFFSDPDGIRFELVAHRRLRDEIRERWNELGEFENPLDKLGRRSST
jgi:catechol 2,3-dioxygenase-like lactoylglutathione lyase family enzyme